MRNPNLLVNFFESQGYEIWEKENEFIIYKIKDSMICVDRVYTATGERGSLPVMLDQLHTFVKIEYGCSTSEAYLDKDGKYRDRMKQLIEEYGYVPFKETDDYVHYRMKI